MQILNARLPIVPEGPNTVIIVLGTPEAKVGAEVKVVTPVDDNKIPSAFVAGVDTAPLNELSPDVVELFGHQTTASLHAHTEKVYGTGLPRNIIVTIYTLVDAPVTEFLGQIEDPTDDDELDAPASAIEG